MIEKDIKFSRVTYIKVKSRISDLPLTLILTQQGHMAAYLQYILCCSHVYSDI